MSVEQVGMKLSPKQKSLRVLRCVLSVLLCFTILCSFGAAFLRFGVFQTSRLTDAVVDDGYVAEIRDFVAEKLREHAPYYAIPEEVIFAGLEDAELRSASWKGAKAFFDFSFYGEELVQSTYPASLFYDQLELYVADLKTEDGSPVPVNEGALQEIADECAALTAAYCNPVSQNILLDAMNAVIPRTLLSALQTFASLFVVFLCVSIALALLIWKLGAKRAGCRLYAVCAPFFCAMTLIAVPTFLFLRNNLLDALSLAPSTLRSFLTRLPAILFSSERVWAYSLFAVSFVLLALSIWRRISSKPVSTPYYQTKD